jgi:hypothetical protein
MEAQLSSMNMKVDGLTQQVGAGFTETKSLLTEQQQANLGMQKAIEALVMATAGFQSSVAGLLSGGASAPRRELPAPQARLAICPGGGSNVTEVSEEKSHQYIQSCFASNEGGSASHSSQRSQIGAACGGGASESSRFVVPTEIRGSSGGSTLVAARQLGVGQHLQNFEQNFAKMKQNDFNNFIGAAIRNFVVSFPPSQQDEMACVLLGMVNGKKYSAHNHIIIHSNESVFRRFFGELATKFPSNAVKIANNLGQQCSFPFKTVSIDQSAMLSLIRVLRGEE